MKNKNTSANTNQVADENGNINCTNCENCKNCADCLNCKNCKNCTDCIDCNNCKDCDKDTVTRDSLQKTVLNL